MRLHQDMLWTEPWLQLASSVEGTRIPPPPPPPLTAGESFRLLSVTDGLTAQWLGFVGSGLSVEAARRRIGACGAHIAWLSVADGQAATCLLRPAGEGIWHLEAFVARPQGKRLGERLLRHVMWSLWGPRGITLVFQWELAGLPALVGAWWRGWLGAAVTVERGWRWRRTAEQEACGFCPVTAAWIPPAKGPATDGRPLLVLDGSNDSAVVVADSGLCDGWGIVLDVTEEEEPDWSRVAAVGGWRELWYRGSAPPTREGWTWTGEWVVIGRVGVGRPIQTRWLTADIN